VKHTRFAAAAAALSSVLVTVATVYCLWRFSLPDGTYDFPGFVAEGYSYLVFHNGKVTLVTPEARKPFGSYYKDRGRWVWTSLRGEKCYLRASFLKLRTLDENGKEARDSPLWRLFVLPHAKVPA
jgi:hypothetical protein